MSRHIQSLKQRPSLLYIIAILVVVAVAGGRFFGFAPGGKAGPDQGGQLRQGTEQPSQPGRVLPDPTKMTQVLVYHTHTTENYSPKESFAGRGPGDVVSVGKSVVAALEREGIGAVHVQTVHDLPKWNEAYPNARRSVEEALTRHSGLQVLVDIHRDAIEEGQPPGYTTAMVQGEPVARILFVVGSTSNPRAQENVRYAQRLQQILEGIAPGITRGVRVMARETNQDVHPRSIIAYIGDYRDNTLEEAERSAEFLAKALVELLREDG